MLIMNSSKCKRTFTRIFDIENEVDTQQSAPNMSPTSQPSGQPALGATPLQGSRRSDRFLKHAKSDTDRWRRDIDLFSESESDEEEIKGFDRIILIPRTSRPRHPRPHTSRTVPGPRATVAAVIPERSKATEADARQHAIPSGFCLDKWDPDEEPIVLLGSVFDANSLGEWIYQWTVYTYGPATPALELASILWTLITQIASKFKRAEMALPSVRKVDDKETLEDFLDSGDRLMMKLRRLLKACELSISKAFDKNDQRQARVSTGVEFAKTLFGEHRELDGLEIFLYSAALWNLRFEVNCSEAVGGPSPTSRFYRSTNKNSDESSIKSLVDSLRTDGGIGNDNLVRPSPSQYIALKGRDVEDGVHHSQAGNIYVYPARLNTRHKQCKYCRPGKPLYDSERRMLPGANPRKQRVAFLATDLSDRRPDETGDQIGHGNASISDNSSNEQSSTESSAEHQYSENDSDDSGLGGGARIEDRLGSRFVHGDRGGVPVVDLWNPGTAGDLNNNSVGDWGWVSKNRREERVDVDDTDISPERTKRPPSRLSRGSRESDWSTSVGRFHQRRRRKTTASTPTWPEYQGEDERQ